MSMYQTPYNEIKSSLRDGEVTNESVVNFVVSKKLHALRYYSKRFSLVREDYDFFRGIYAGNNPTNRHNVHVPLLFSYIKTNTAATLSTLLADTPYIDFESGPPELAPLARKWSLLVSQELDDCDTFRKMNDFLDAAHIYGTGFLRYGWCTQSSTQTQRLYDAYGQEHMIDVPVTHFDGPDWQNLDILDVLVEPGAKNIRSARWAIIRYYADLDSLIEEAASNPEYYKFDPIALQNVVRAGMSDPLMDQYMMRSGVYNLPNAWYARRTEPFSKPVEILEFWGEVPEEFAIRGNRHIVCTIANGRSILRYDTNPHGRTIPILDHCPMPDPHFLHGIGKVEVARKLAAVTNKIVNTKLDLLERIIDPPIAVNDQINVTQDSWRTSPGKLFKVNGSVKDAFMPMMPPIQGFGEAFSELELVGKWMQQGLGIVEETIQGIGGNRATAREIMIKAQGASNRLMLEAMLAERGIMEPLAQAFYEMSDRWMQLPMQIQRIGSAAVLDDVTGMPTREPQVVGIDDIGLRLRARARGATRMTSKATMAQNLMTAMPALMQNPMGMQLVNWYGFFIEFFKALDLNPKDLLVQRQIPMLNQMGAVQGSKNPEAALLGQGMMNDGGTDLSQLNGVPGNQNMPMMGIGGMGGF